MAKVFRPEDDQMSRSSRCNKEQNNEHLRLTPQNQIKILSNTKIQQQQQQQQHSLFSQASWGRLEMKPERNKFKVQAH